MKKLSKLLGIIGILLVIYAVAAKFVNGPTAFGYVMALDPKTVVLGANTLLLIAILLFIYDKKD
ncbi:MAG: hypothetical protein PHU91_01220 [Candidatus Omnitrophica bacterium]|nr:hypothetical protein [Candidatus Omnitrophota bacterium]MDD5236281.1 hypothetical protein [Candidatus Omnitrophota bacterium]MDD5610529.1 hypothetical protein [Candidatus Omnitrophota bacterium]